MKLWSINHVFSAPWRQTCEAVWKKYPNDQQPNVKTIDVLDRKVTADGRLVTTRLFGSQFAFPSLIVSLLGLPDICYAIEYSEVDLSTQTMTLRMINSTFGSVLSVDEKLVYTRNPADPLNETVLKQGARISISGIPFTGYFEDMLVSRFDDSSKVGRSAVQNVVNTITVENILKTVTKELQQLSHEVDSAANRIDDAFSISEKMAELSKDLDRASGMINTEIKCFSDKLQSEFEQILRTLENELSQISVKVNLPESCGRAFESSNIRLFEAVVKAGIPVLDIGQS